jgi:hypothetical protein
LRRHHTVKFAAIAASLRISADEAMLNMEGCEEIASRMLPSPGIEDTLVRLRHRAVMVDEAHHLILALAPIERPVRWLLSAHSALRHVRGFVADLRSRLPAARRVFRRRPS